MCSKLKNNYGDACYLINDGSCRFRTDDIGYSITSPWTVDKRDPSGKIIVWRDIEELSNGMLGFEFIADIPEPKDGTCFKISDSAGKSLMNLEISAGGYLFNGVKTNFPAQSGTVFVLTSSPFCGTCPGKQIPCRARAILPQKPGLPPDPALLFFAVSGDS